jgi:hypothetical protein
MVERPWLPFACMAPAVALVGATGACGARSSLDGTGAAPAGSERTSTTSTGSSSSGSLVGSSSSTDTSSSASSSSSGASSTSSSSGSPPPLTHLVLFGGLGPGEEAAAIGDTWVWDGSAWTERVVSGPSARYAFAMTAYQGKVVLFGGSDNQALSFYGDTWEWDGNVWTEVATTGPSPRSDASMAVAAGKVVLFGGSSVDVNLGDTWVWDGHAWAEQNVVGPPGRYGGQMVSLGDKAILVGGQGLPTYRDTWAWDGSSWTELAMGTGTAAPTVPEGTGAGMAAFGSTMVLSDLLDAIPGPLNSTWTWDGMSWTKRAGMGPSLRYEPVMGSTSSTSPVALLFGGSLESGSMEAAADTWAWDGQDWTQLDVSGPPGRYSSGMAAF